RTRANGKPFSNALQAGSTRQWSRQRCSTKGWMFRKRRSPSFWAVAVRRANILSDSVAFSANARTSWPSLTRSLRAERSKPGSAGGDARPKPTPGALKKSLASDDMLTKELLRYRIEAGQIRPALLDPGSPRYLQAARELGGIFGNHVGHT